MAIRRPNLVSIRAVARPRNAGFVPAFRLFVAAFCLRIIVFPFAEVIDSDAVARIYGALEWLQDPHVVTEGTWLPLHRYFLAGIIGCTGSQILMPMLAHVVLGSLLVVPVYAMTKRAFPDKPAWLVALFIGCVPVLFQNSFHTLTGVPTALLVLLSWNALHRMVGTGAYKDAIWAGIWLTLACGMRFEAWMVLALFTGLGVAFRRWRQTLVFWAVGMLFPAFWMIGSYVAHGDWFYSLARSYNWNIIISGTNDKVSIADLWGRALFFPWSWLLAITPPVAVFILAQAVRGIWKKNWAKDMALWSLPLLVFACVFGYKALNGTLYQQHRFTGLLVVLSWPLVAWAVAQVHWTRATKVVGGLLVVAAIPLSWVWVAVPMETIFHHGPARDGLAKARAGTLHGAVAVPRLFDRDFANFAPVILKSLGDGDGLILDFAQWESTYNVMLQSNADADQVFVVNGAPHGPLPRSLTYDLIHRRPTGLILFRCGSRMLRDFVPVPGGMRMVQDWDKQGLELTPEYTVRDFTLYRYSWKQEFVPLEGEPVPLSACAPDGSPEYHRNRILANRGWYQDLKRRALVDGTPFDVYLERESNWLSDHH